jgi:hypothetical protein
VACDDGGLLDDRGSPRRYSSFLFHCYSRPTTAGDLVSRHRDQIDLCGDCCEGLGDWLRGPRQTAALAAGTATTLSAVESSVLVGGA